MEAPAQLMRRMLDLGRPQVCNCCKLHPADVMEVGAVDVVEGGAAAERQRAVVEVAHPLTLLRRAQFEQQAPGTHHLPHAIFAQRLVGRVSQIAVDEAQFVLDLRLSFSSREWEVDALGHWRTYVCSKAKPQAHRVPGFRDIRHVGPMGDRTGRFRSENRRPSKGSAMPAADRNFAKKICWAAC